MFRTFAKVSSMTAISRVLGFVRDILMASVLGAGPIADVFFVAFRFPNVFRSIFAEGALSAAFIPIFSRTQEKEGSNAALEFAAQVQAFLMVVLLIFTGGVLVCMPYLTPVLAPGFQDDPAQLDMAVRLLRICFPYLPFMALVALYTGVLNTHRRFTAGAAAPIVLNVFMILTLLVLIPRPSQAPPYLAWTVFAAGLGQVALMGITAKRHGLLPRAVLPKLTTSVRLVIARMIPGVVSSGALQMNILIGTLIATLETGAVSRLYYADRIYQLPLALIGIGLGVVLLPDLSQRLQRGDIQNALLRQNKALEIALLLSLPAAAGLIAIPELIISVLFERGAFLADDSQATAKALRIFAAGLPAFIAIKVLQPAFYAREDTRTPMIYAVSAIIVNTLLSIGLFFTLGFLGIALATTFAGWGHVVALGAGLMRRGYWRPDKSWLIKIPIMLGASTAMAALVVFCAASFGEITFLSTKPFIALIGIICLGLIFYGAAVVLLGLVRTGDVKAFLARSANR